MTCKEVNNNDMYACLLSHFSRAQLFETYMNCSRQVPLSMGFSRQEYCSGLPCPPPGDLPDPGTESVSLMSPELAGGFFTTSATWEAQIPGDVRQIFFKAIYPNTNIATTTTGDDNKKNGTKSLHQ